MQSQCRHCHKPVTGIFASGMYEFKHCRQRWRKDAKFVGVPVASQSGSKIGAALGGLLGVMHGDISGGAAGVTLGTAIGKLFDSDNGATCVKCRIGRAYPTGRSKYGKSQFQCVACKSFLYP